MRTKNSTRFVPRLIAVLVFSMLCVAVARAQEPGPFEAKVISVIPPKTWPHKLVRKWQVSAGSWAATPIVAGERVYLFSRDTPSSVESTRCLKAADGTVIWTESYHFAPDDRASLDLASLPSTPALTEDRLILRGVTGICSGLDVTGDDPMRQRVRWRTEELTDFRNFHTAMAPLVAGSLAIFHLGSPDITPHLIAYDVKSGAERWRVNGDGPAYAAPAVMHFDDTWLLIVQSETSIFAVDASKGTLAWQIKVGDSVSDHDCAGPLVDGQTFYHFGAGRGTTAVKLEKKDGKIVSTDLWNNSDLSPQYNTPILKNGFLYGLSQAQHGQFVCVNAKDGKTAWSDPAADRGLFAPLTDGGSTLLSVNPKGELLVLEATEKRFHELARFKVAEADTYMRAVLNKDGNVIYIVDKGNLTAWDIQ